MRITAVLNIDTLRAEGIDEIPLRGLLQRIQIALDSEFPLARSGSIEVRELFNHTTGELASMLDPMPKR